MIALLVLTLQPYYNPHHLAVTILLFFDLGDTFIMVSSAGSLDKATAGQPSLMRFKNIICRARRGMGMPTIIAVAK
jgi:hypothetical protein